ncbi:MAG TPA: biosynthetic peptidoglycan transglycosylase [Leptospiraceae bacterium]|nr:biosynthetic peptidoglycan transglycosylase [Leptospiraceae bacterium]
MSVYRSALKKFFFNKKVFYIFLFLFLLFIPWVPVLYFGVLIYFPYDETGKSRYMRITGPLVQYVGAEWVSTDRIPPVCKKAIVVAEDSEFYNHSGISIESIKSSFEYNRRQGRIVSGASTITQQFIKNAFLSRQKTYVRKLREAIGALMFNLLFSKDQQITWYLNVVEFGPRIYGLQSASNFYFKKDPFKLNAKECAVLSTFLTRPVLFGKSYKNGLTSVAFQKRFHRIYNGLVPPPAKKEKQQPEVIEEEDIPEEDSE